MGIIHYVVVVVVVVVVVAIVAIVVVVAVVVVAGGGGGGGRGRGGAVVVGSHSTQLTSPIYIFVLSRAGEPHGQHKPCASRDFANLVNYTHAKRSDGVDKYRTCLTGAPAIGTWWRFSVPDVNPKSKPGLFRQNKQKKPCRS